MDEPCGFSFVETPAEPRWRYDLVVMMIHKVMVYGLSFMVYDVWFGVEYMFQA